MNSLNEIKNKAIKEHNEVLLNLVLGYEAFEDAEWLLDIIDKLHKENTYLKKEIDKEMHIAYNFEGQLHEANDEIKKLKNELSSLCPIAELSAIETLKVEKEYMMDIIKKYEEALNSIKDIAEEILEGDIEKSVNDGLDF